MRGQYPAYIMLLVIKGWYISSCEVPRLLRGTGGSGDEYAFKLIVSYVIPIVPRRNGCFGKLPLTIFLATDKLACENIRKLNHTQL